MLIPDVPPVADMAESLPTVPEATYNLKVHKAEYVAVPKGRDAKGPYIKCQYMITGPNINGADNPQMGRLVFENLSVTGKGTFRLRELLTVTGHPADFKLQDSDQLLGLEFGAAVTTELGTTNPQTGEKYADKSVVKRYLPIIQ